MTSYYHNWCEKEGGERGEREREEYTNNQAKTLQEYTVYNFKQSRITNKRRDEQNTGFKIWIGGFAASKTHEPSPERDQRVLNAALAARSPIT